MNDITSTPPATLTSEHPYTEVVMRDSSGQSMVLGITLTGNQQVTINVSSSVDITAPTCTINGNLQVNGTIQATGDISAGSVTMETHRHGNSPVASG